VHQLNTPGGQQNCFVACSPTFNGILIAAPKGKFINLVHFRPDLRTLPILEIESSESKDDIVKCLKFGSSGERAMTVDSKGKVTIMDFVFA
jgi:hypothetical protein